MHRRARPILIQTAGETISVNEGVSAGLTRLVPLEEKKKSGTHAANRRDDHARLSLSLFLLCRFHSAWTAREGEGI